MDIKQGDKPGTLRASSQMLPTCVVSTVFTVLVLTDSSLVDCTPPILQLNGLPKKGMNCVIVESQQI